MPSPNEVDVILDEFAAPVSTPGLEVQIPIRSSEVSVSDNEPTQLHNLNLCGARRKPKQQMAPTAPLKARLMYRVVNWWGWYWMMVITRTFTIASNIPHIIPIRRQSFQFVSGVPLHLFQSKCLSIVHSWWTEITWETIGRILTIYFNQYSNHIENFSMDVKETRSTDLRPYLLGRQYGDWVNCIPGSGSSSSLPPWWTNLKYLDRNQHSNNLSMSLPQARVHSVDFRYIVWRLDSPCVIPDRSDKHRLGSRAEIYEIRVGCLDAQMLKMIICSIKNSTQCCVQFLLPCNENVRSRRPVSPAEHLPSGSWILPWGFGPVRLRRAYHNVWRQAGCFWR